MRRGDRRPDRRPDRRRRALGRFALGIAGLSVLGAGAAGCAANDPVYFPGPTVLESDGTGAEVQATVSLRVRASTASEDQERQKASGKLGYDVPQLREDRLHVEVKYTITNLGDREGLFALFVDGANEFTRFDYQTVAAVFAAADEDAPPVGLIQPPNLPILAPGQIYQGTIREDDLHEAAVDLDAMGRWMAPFVAVLINRSEVNPQGLAMVPNAPVSDVKQTPPVQWILPALWEVTPRFSSDQPMTCQFLVRVRDDDQRLWEDGNGEFVPAPTAFTPVVMP